MWRIVPPTPHEPVEKSCIQHCFIPPALHCLMICTKAILASHAYEYVAIELTHQAFWPRSDPQTIVAAIQRFVPDQYIPCLTAEGHHWTLICDVQDSKSVCNIAVVSAHRYEATLQLKGARAHTLHESYLHIVVLVLPHRGALAGTRRTSFESQYQERLFGLAVTVEVILVWWWREEHLWSDRDTRSRQLLAMHISSCYVTVAIAYSFC